MTQPFADALTWMPKSRALGATLTRAHDMARAQGHEAVLLEHLLQALVEDPDASAMLLQCNIDLLGLNAAVAEHLQRQPVNENTQPDASQGLLLILEYAAAAARQSKRSEVTGAIVLAAMVGEGKSEAARMLTAAGLTFQDAIGALRKAPSGRAQMPEAVAPPATEPPPLPVASKPAAVAAQAPSSDPLPPALPASVTSTPPPIPQPSVSTPAPNAVQPLSARPTMEEDPLTTARRRVAALKSVQGGLPPPPLRDPVDAAEPQRIAVGQAATSFAGADVDAQVEGAPQAWVPPPTSGGPGSAGVRPSRMPPPIPPMMPRPTSNVTPFAKPAEARAAVRAPWADPHAASADMVAPLSVPTTAPVIGEPIDVRRLVAGLPQRLRERVPATIEVRIPRSSVMGTAAAMRAAADETKETALTRAVCVTLKAPSGGLFLETAAPETQWFDNRGFTRDDDEVRWRWVATPQSSGTKQVVLAVSMRTIAADGTMIETALPEAAASIKVSSNYREGLRRLGRAAIAVAVGIALTLLATGDLFSVFGLGGK